MKTPFTRSMFILGLGTAIVIIFYPVFKNGFVLDDLWWLDNVAYWQDAPLKHIFLSGDVAFFEPMTNLFWYICHGLFRLESFPYYIATMLIQCIIAIVLVAMTRTFSDSLKIASISGPLFIFYPCHYEAGYYLSAVDTLFQSLFYLLTVYVYLIYLRTGRPATYIFSIICLICAFLAKQSTTTLVMILILADVLLKPISLKTVKRLTPFVLLTVLYIIFILLQIGMFSETGKSVRSNPVIAVTEPKSMEYNLSVHGFTVYGRTLVGIIISPFQPGVFFSPFQFPASMFTVLAGSLISITVLIIILIRWKGFRREILFGTGWLCITLIPFVFWKFKILASSRYTHLPAIGICLIWGIILSQFLTFITTKTKRFVSIMIGLTIFAAVFINAVVESRAMNELPRYQEARANRTVIKTLLDKYNETGQHLYLHDFSGLKPWQVEPVSRLYFEGNLSLLDEDTASGKLEKGIIATTLNGQTMFRELPNDLFH